MLTAPLIRVASCSSARRTSRTTTSRWWRTCARSAKVAVGKRRECSVGPVLGAAGGLGGRAVDADPDQLALGLGDVLGGLAEQRHRGAPGDQPAQVGRERAVEAEVEGAGGVAGGERGAVAQVDDPLAGLDAPAELARRRPRAGGEVRLGRPGGVGRRHVGVVGGAGAETVEELADVGLLVLGQDRVGLLLLHRSSTRSRRTGWRRRTSRTRGSGRPRRRRAAGRRAGAPRRAGGGPARACARGRAGLGDRWRRTAASRRRRRRRRCRLPALRQVAQGVGEVGEGVARSGQRGDAHAVADLDDVAVARPGCARRTTSSAPLTRYAAPVRCASARPR